MEVEIHYAREQVRVRPRPGTLIEVRRAALVPSVPDVRAAVRAALDQPLRFPPLQQALTPDDHITIVIDEHVPRLVEVLSPLLERVLSAGVTADAITLLCHTPSTGQPWIEELPDDFQDVRIKVHDPKERRELAYLAATKAGRRIYLSRDVVDADQSIILAGLGYDPLLGVACAEGALYPALSDEATRNELLGQLSMEAPGNEPWPVRAEANEVAWLLGAPIFVRVIAGAGDSISHVVCGLADASPDADQLLDERWHVRVPYAADLVVAALAGAPARHDFAALAQALACAARVVKPAGRIVLLSRAAPELGPGGELIRNAEEPDDLLAALEEMNPPDLTAAYQWAWGLQQAASVYLLSGLPAETAEELFTTPLEHAEQVQKLIDAAASCLILPDAHRTLAEVE